MSQGPHSPLTHSRQRGFTLVELVVVITVMSILAVSLMVFFGPTLNGYFDAKRRAKLTDMADVAIRRMVREVRLAVPNSLRLPANDCFQLVPTTTGGRYRMAPDTIWDAANPATPSAPIDGSVAINQFDVLSTLSAAPVAGDWVVIDNQNTADIYAGTTRVAITNPNAALPNASLGTRRITLASSFTIPLGYGGGRFQVVSNTEQTVFYTCTNPGIDAQGNGTGTLLRTVSPFTASTCPSTGSVVATRVSACTFVYNPNQGATQQSGFIWLQLAITEANETATVAFGAHVDNTP